jgi:hypothetical protein
MHSIIIHDPKGKEVLRVDQLKINSEEKLEILLSLITESK